MLISVNAQTVTRGPYLQMPTSSSMIVRWRTDVPTVSRVYYHTSLAGLNAQFTEQPSLTTEHSVTLQFLNPLTEYFFAVGDENGMLSGGDSSHRFTTWPENNADVPVRLWAIGDFGKGNSEQAAVTQSFLNEVGEDMPNFWIWLGDNAYDSGTDAEFSNKVFGTNYQSLFTRMPFLPTPGNHDYLSIMTPVLTINPANHDGPYYQIVDVPTNSEMGGYPSGYELFYSYDYGNVHFLSLNSEIGSIFTSSHDWVGASPFNSFSSSPFTQWLHNDLQANDKPWVVAYFHQPPHTDGSHDSDAFWEVFMEAMRENICPILESYGVDLVLSGHSHVYERSYLINGFYGLPADFNPSQHVVDGSSGRLSEGTPYIKYLDGPNAGLGTVYVVQGNSGSKDDDADLNHPAHFFGHGCATCVGSTFIEVNGDTLTGKYLASTGEFLDEFNIIKTSITVGNDIEEEFGSLEISPNPFDQSAEIKWNLPRAGVGRICLRNIGGQIVAELFKGTISTSGGLVLDGTDLNLESGIYVVELTTDFGSMINKIVKLN